MTERSQRRPTGPASTDPSPATQVGVDKAPDGAAADRQGNAGDVDAAVSVGWCLYLIECRNGSYYAGITNRLAARYAAHVAGRGARYTRANPPLQLLGSRPFPDRAAAARAEWQIRQLPRELKRAFLDLCDP